MAYEGGQFLVCLEARGRRGRAQTIVRWGQQGPDLINLINFNRLSIRSLMTVCMWAAMSRLRRDVVYGRITAEKGWCFTGGGKWNCHHGMNELYSFSFVTQGIIKIDG